MTVGVSDNDELLQIGQKGNYKRLQARGDGTVAEVVSTVPARSTASPVTQLEVLQELLAELRAMHQGMILAGTCEDLGNLT